MNVEFIGFPKIGRISRLCTITEKLDGTNAQIYIGEDGTFLAGSRSRWITPNSDGKVTDNYGFAEWAYAHKDELMTLGPGRHFGEWWGLGIQRNYGLPYKKFSLFNAGRWLDKPNKLVSLDIVPVLFNGEFSTENVDAVLSDLKINGSKAVPGYLKPEGIVVYHHGNKSLFKKTIEYDTVAKSQTNQVACA